MFCVVQVLLVDHDGALGDVAAICRSALRQLFCQLKPEWFGGLIADLVSHFSFSGTCCC